ncbi:MAG: hypothetical protein IKK88_01755, partial [Oscillospiraceae bacterium]|nr:hypothetical protein [Oscillospiraceae bacterium]
MKSKRIIAGVLATTICFSVVPMESKAVEAQEIQVTPSEIKTEGSSVDDIAEENIVENGDVSLEKLIAAAVFQRA